MHHYNILLTIRHNFSVFSLEAKIVIIITILYPKQVEKARKLRLDTYDIVVDKCAVSPNGRHIVAVTSNNMVCIWKRGKEDENEQSPS